MSPHVLDDATNTHSTFACGNCIHGSWGKACNYYMIYTKSCYTTSVGAGPYFYILFGFLCHPNLPRLNVHPNSEPSFDELVKIIIVHDKDWPLRLKLLFDSDPASYKGKRVLPINMLPSKDKYMNPLSNKWCCIPTSL